MIKYLLPLMLLTSGLQAHTVVPPGGVRDAEGHQVVMVNEEGTNNFWLVLSGFEKGERLSSTLGGFGSMKDYNKFVFNPDEDGYFYVFVNNKAWVEKSGTALRS